MLAPLRANDPAAPVAAVLLRISPAEPLPPIAPLITVGPAEEALALLTKVVVWGRSRLAEIVGTAAPASTWMPTPAARPTLAAFSWSVPGPVTVIAVAVLNSSELTTARPPRVAVVLAALTLVVLKIRSLPALGAVVAGLRPFCDSE